MNRYNIAPKSAEVRHRTIGLVSIGAAALALAGYEAPPVQATVAQEAPPILDFRCDYAPTIPQFIEPNCPNHVPLYQFRDGRIYYKGLRTNLPVD